MAFNQLNYFTFLIRERKSREETATRRINNETRDNLRNR